VTEQRPLAVVDIDGVLADVRHRLHHVKNRPKDWAAFFAAAPDDQPLDKGLETVRRLAEVCDVVYLSGRPEHCRQDTLDWFDKHGVPPGELHLRRRGDFRPARVTKVEILDRLSEHAHVSVFIDDDPLVCEAARAAGYDVLPADWMPEQPTLLEAQEVEGRT
jgi:DNA-binding transcriptional ArsR family regulator